MQLFSSFEIGFYTRAYNEDHFNVFLLKNMIGLKRKKIF